MFSLVLIDALDSVSGRMHGHHQQYNVYQHATNPAKSSHCRGQDEELQEAGDLVNKHELGYGPARESEFGEWVVETKRVASRTSSKFPVRPRLYKT